MQNEGRAVNVTFGAGKRTFGKCEAVQVCGENLAAERATTTFLILIKGASVVRASWLPFCCLRVSNCYRSHLHKSIQIPHYKNALRTCTSYENDTYVDQELSMLLAYMNVESGRL